MNMESQSEQFDKRQKTGGRKKGTPNHERIEVVQLPACCPKCFSTNRKVQAITGDEVFHIVDRQFNGRLYNRQTIRHCVCECGQYLAIKEFSYSQK